jgi:hypothetical protein
MPPRYAALSLTLLALLPVSAFARKQETGFLDRAITVSGETYRYQVFVPYNWDKHKKWPVILFLHGAGERGENGLLQTDVGLAHAIREHAGNFPFVVVMPQCPKGKLWTEPEMETQAFAALDRSMKEFDGDSERIYLTGILNGRIRDLGFSRQVSASLRGLRANLRRNLWSAEFQTNRSKPGEGCASCGSVCRDRTPGRKDSSMDFPRRRG